MRKKLALLVAVIFQQKELERERVFVEAPDYNGLEKYAHHIDFAVLGNVKGIDEQLLSSF